MYLPQGAGGAPTRVYLGYTHHGVPRLYHHGIPLPTVPPWVYRRTYTADLRTPDAAGAPTRAVLKEPWALTRD